MRLRLLVFIGFFGSTAGCRNPSSDSDSIHASQTSEHLAPSARIQEISTQLEFFKTARQEFLNWEAENRPHRPTKNYPENEFTEKYNECERLRQSLLKLLPTKDQNPKLVVLGLLNNATLPAVFRVILFGYQPAYPLKAKFTSEPPWDSNHYALRLQHWLTQVAPVLDAQQIVGIGASLEFAAAQETVFHSNLGMPFYLTQESRSTLQKELLSSSATRLGEISLTIETSSDSSMREVFKVKVKPILDELIPTVQAILSKKQASKQDLDVYAQTRKLIQICTNVKDCNQAVGSTYTFLPPGT